jgi:hypothetical protein
LAAVVSCSSAGGVGRSEAMALSGAWQVKEQSWITGLVWAH